MTSASALVAAGQEALRRGAWAEARDLLQRALAVEETPEALEALALSAWWLEDVGAMFENREKAFRLYRAAGDPRSAARVATALGMDFADYRAELAVAAGWFQRAASLLEGVDECPEHGWLALFQGVAALTVEGDIEKARAYQLRAVECARHLSIFDLEMLSAILSGLILVREGRVADGLSRMDEAMAAAIGGEMTDLGAIGNASCAVIYACEAVADYDRAVQWCDRATEFARRWGLTSLFALCRSYYATVLIWRCQWVEAETELTSSARDLETSRPTSALESLAKLGELRRRQGRHAEADDLLRRAETHPMALYGKAALALDRNDPRSAVDLIKRFLRRITDEDQAERVFATEILARACIALGRLDEAEQETGEAATLAEHIGTNCLRASAALTAGIFLLARGDLDAARETLEDAIDLFESTGNAFDAARARLDLARALTALDRPDAAMHEATAARDCFERLGAIHHAALAARLLTGDGRIPMPHARALPGLTARESEVLWLLATGKTNQDIAEDLVLSIRTVERHISTIYEKLGLQGAAARAAATAFALNYRP